MNDLERLVAIEEIKQLKARYFRLVDTKQWGELLDVFAEDVVFDASGGGSERIGGGDPVKRGASVLVKFIRETASEPIVIHHGYTPEIEILSPISARGIWALEDQFYWPEGNARRKLHGFGYYHDTYDKIQGRWRIKSMRAQRLKMEIS